MGLGTIVGSASNQPVGFPGVLDGAWGDVISLELKNGWIVDYCHLSQLGVDVGYKVMDVLQVLGHTGETGIPGVTVFGPHLHAQLRVGHERFDFTPYL